MKILIVDDIVDLAELVEFLVQEYAVTLTSTTIATSGNQAIKILRENPEIDLCICDHNMPDGMGYDVLNYIIKEELKTRFVLCSSIDPLDFPDKYDAKNIFLSMRKPDVGIGMDRLFKLLEKEFKTPVNLFIPITLHVLKLIKKAPCDLFIRVSERKFIRCLNKFEDFTEEDYIKYLDKRIDHLFVKKLEHMEEVNQLILKAIQKLLDQRTLPLTEKISMAHAQLTYQIKHAGVTPEIAQASKKMIEKSIELISQTVAANEFWKQLNLLGDYPSRLYTLHSMLICGALLKSKLNSPENQFNLVFCAFIQDIALDSIALAEICDYKEFQAIKKNLSEVEIKKYLEHPVKAAELLNQFENLPDGAFRVILEQNEMPDGSGFPSQLAASKIDPLSCFFIVTGIFARHVLKDGDRFDFKAFIINMQKKGYAEGNFKTSMDALKAMQNSIVF